LSVSACRFEEMLGQHLHVAEHRHEARVAVPAWNHVHVKVILDAGAGHPAEVPAEIETVR